MCVNEKDRETGRQRTYCVRKKAADTGKINIVKLKYHCGILIALCRNKYNLIEANVSHAQSLSFLNNKAGTAAVPLLKEENKREKECPMYSQ